MPFLNKEYTVPKIDFYTYSRKTILKKIEADLDFAVKWLPEDVEPGKVSRAAGYHLLAKVCLANSEFDKAVAATSAVINSGKYALMTDRFGVVANDDKYNVIWDLHQPENKSVSSNTEGILVCQDKYGITGSTSQGTGSMRQFTPWWSRNSYIKDPDGIQGCVDTPKNWEILAFGRGVGQVRTTNYFNYEIWGDSRGPSARHRL